MDHHRAGRLARLARVVETVGADIAAPDVRSRRAGRLARVQAAWLSDLTPRSLKAATRELKRRDPGTGP